MTEPTAGTATATVPTRAIDGRTMIGHVIVCQGQGGQHDVIAVWQVDTEGVNTGAWIVPVSVARTDTAVARTLLQCCLQRAVIAWDPTQTLALLRRLERAAHVGESDWSTSAIAFPDLLTEIGEIRSDFEKRIIEEQQVKKAILPLEWEIDLPNPIPQDAEELRKAARLIRPKANPAAQEALLLGSLLRWCVQRWRETLTILKRRKYLEPSVKQLGVLPPRWERDIADAYTQITALREE